MCFTVALVRNNELITAERYYNELPIKGIKPDAGSTLFSDDATKEKSISKEAIPQYYFVSGFSHPHLPIVKPDGIFLYEWGLMPSWIKDAEAAKDIRTKTLNAVGETVFEKPSYRKSIASQRCLLGISAFYEWREVNGVKYPYLIHATGNDIFSLGAIYDSWINKETGEIKNTFSILTTPANPLMEKIHNLKKRMPLILSPREEMQWIDPSLKTAQITALIKPYDENDMTAYTISRTANNARNNRNVPEIMEKVLYDELVGSSE